MIEVLPRHRLELDVHEALIMRSAKGDSPDCVMLATSKQGPSISGLMTFQTFVPRGQGEAWVDANFPGVELRVCDFSRKTGYVPPQLEDSLARF
jgi:hypothetical protein